MTCRRGWRSHWRGTLFPAFSIAAFMDWFARDSSSTLEYQTTSIERRRCWARGSVRLAATRLPLVFATMPWHDIGQEGESSSLADNMTNVLFSPFMNMRDIYDRG